jgi:NAD(P)-dependent dehydrogenase (short-subunit alcohol dehydrogenase family)
MAGRVKNTMKTIVMTGGTAGIGLAALQQIRQSSDVRLLVGARGQASAAVESLPLDLTRLASVRSFAAAVEERLGKANIDGLVLNAGMQVSDVRQHTEDGFETTFAVNHLAHYLLLRLLMPRLAPGATVVITTSNLHDPKTNPIAPPEHADGEKLARGQVKLIKLQGSRSGIRAYAASKLCNLLTARALASSAFAQDRGLRVIAFNPGLTPGTQLTRNQSLIFRLSYAVVMRMLSAIQRMNTVAGGGSLLADLALGRIVPPAGRLYASQVKRHLTWPDISELASDDAVMAKLWRDSAALGGLLRA